MPAIEAELELNLDNALQALDDLSTRFDEIVTQLGDNLSTVMTQSFDDVVSHLDDILGNSVSVLASNLSETDLSGLTSSIQDAISVATSSGEIPPIEIPIDTADLTAQLQDAFDSVDTSSLDTSLGDTSNALDEVTHSSEKTKGGLEGASQAAQALGIGADAAKGSFSSLVESAVPGAAAFVGVAASIGELVKEADAAQLATQQLNAVFGKSASVVKTLNIAGLNYDVDKLSQLTGASVPKLELAAASFGRLQISAGKSKEQAASLSKELIVLAANVAATHPSLGSASDVIDTLSRALQGNVRLLNRYGINLNKTQIDAEAMAESHKTLKSELNATDRQTAILTLTMKALGDTVGKNVADSAKTATVQFRALKEQLVTEAAKIGTPLIQPVLELVRALLPVGEAVGQAFGAAITAILPGIKDVAQVVVKLTPAIEGLTKAFKFLAPIIEPLVVGFIALKVAKEISTMFTLLSVKTLEIGDSFKKFAAELKSGKSEFIGFGESATRLAAGLAIGAASFEQAGKSGAQGALGVAGLAASGAEIGSIFGPAGTVIGGIAGATLGIGKMTGQIADGGPTVTEYRKQFEELGKSMTGVRDSGAVFAGFIKNLGSDDALSLLSGHAKGVTDELEAMAKTSPVAAGKVVQSLVNLRSEANKPIFNPKEIDKLNAALEKGSVEHTKLAQATAQGAIAAANDTAKQDQLTASIITGTTASGAALFATSLQTAQLKSQSSVAQAAVTAAASLTAATNMSTDAIRSTATAYAQAAQRGKEYKSALDILNTGTLTLTQAQDTAGLSIDGLDKAFETAKGDFSFTTTASKTLEQAISGATTSFEAYKQKMIDASSSQSDIDAATASYSQKLIDLARHYGATDDAIARLLDRQGLVAPANESTVASLQKVGTTIGTEVPAKADSGQAALNQALTKMTDGAKTAIQTVADLFSNNTSIEAGAKKAGQSAAQGLAAGIDNPNSERLVKDAVKSLAESATTHMQVTLQISSPSKVFTKLGEQTAQGFVTGLQNLIPQVGLAAGGLASAAVGGVIGTVAPILGSVGLNGAVSPSYTTPGVGTPGPLIGSQTFIGMDAQAAAAATGREMAIAQRFAGV